MISRAWILGVVSLVGALAALAAIAAGMRHGGAVAPCIERRFEGASFLVCRFDARTQELRLASRDRNGNYMRGFEALAAFLGPEQQKVRFAMNAGMFNDQGAPIGLYVEHGQEQHPLRLTNGPGNFHMKPNGVFFQDENGSLAIETSETFAASPHAARWATQSGPMLVIDGALHPRFQNNGASRLTRNGVGLANDHTAYFVLSNGVVSFGRFARFFRDVLHCRNALFLDGSVSGVWAPRLNRMDARAPIGPMLVVFNG